MKKTALLVTFLVISTTLAFGQTATEPILVKRTFGGYQYHQGEKTLNVNQLASTMKPNEEAFRQIQSAKSAYTMAMISSYAGGFLVGWPLGTAIGGGEPNWTMAAIGAGLIGVAIPFSQRYNKKAKLAVDIYNGALPVSSLQEEIEWKLSMTANGIGLSLRF